jgi:hypothetical protein
LPSDVSRGNPSVKEAFRQVLEMMVGVFAENLPANSSTPREQALAVVSLVVGGMVLARAVDDKAMADDLRAAAHRQVMEMTNWDRSG